MRASEDFILQKVGGINVLIGVGDKAVDFSEFIKLNETGAFIFNFIKEEKTLDEIADAVIKEFDVDKETALSDTREFLNSLKKSDAVIGFDK
ncbi:MAG: PqqD family protein [Candidatus Fimenecus sp.]